MSSLAERIAAKKAAEAAAKEIVHKEEQPDGTIVSTMSGYEIPPATALVPVGETAPAVSVSEGKPLSFAEKMALKKKEAMERNIFEVVATHTEPTASASTAIAHTAMSTEKNKDTITEPKALIPDAVVIGIVAAVAEEDEQAENIAKASPADQQAYADIKAKLNLLSDMADVELKSAMTELKKALLQNPQACYLMLPQDIGQMVIALRAMKNEAVVDATKAPKEKKASKASKPLTAEEIAAAFDEL